MGPISLGDEMKGRCSMSDAVGDERTGQKGRRTPKSDRRIDGSKRAFGAISARRAVGCLMGVDEHDMVGS